MLKHIIFIFICFSCTRVSPQDLNIESLLDWEFESEGQSEIIEELYDLLQHPLDVNKASYYDLQKIPWISPLGAQALIQYRQRHKIREMSELQNIDGFQQHYYIIKKFLTVKPKIREYISITGRHRLVQKSEDVLDDLNSKIYNRLSLHSRQIDGGILVEKDAGESNYADLVHGFASWQADSHPVKITIGQFKAKAGQGLVLWGPFGLRKGSNVLAPAKQRGQGISPFTSSDENSALTGAAVEWSGEKISAFIFASHNPIDAGIAADSIISLPNTGLHTTLLENSRKNAAFKESAGARFQFLFERLDLGMTMVADRYSLPPAQHLTSKMPGTVWGVDYQFRSQLFNFFGETALKQHAFAHQHGVWFEHKNTSLVINYRAFGADFYNANAFAFGSADPNNERGVYFGGEHRCENFQLSTYIDLFKKPYKMIDDLTPGTAFDFLTRLEYNFPNDTRLSLRYKRRKRWDDKNVADMYGNICKQYIQNNSNTVRMQLDIQPDCFIALRSRIECAFQKDNEKYSTSLYHHMSIHNHRSKFQARWTFFNVPDYALRLYQYENDLPGVMNIRLLYGQGSRFFFIYTFHRDRMKFSAKFDYTVYNHKPGIESGDVWTNKQISMQVDWKIN